MEAVRENVTVSAQVLAKNSKCYVESSVIVPDKNPDILKVLQVDATSAVTKHTLQKGRLCAEGKVYVTVLYLPDGDTAGIRSLGAAFDFDDVIDAAELDEGMHSRVTCDVDQVDINLINSRKISLRAVVAINAEVNADRELSYISGIECEDAASKCSEAELYAVTAQDSCEFLMKEQVELMAGKPQIAEILKSDVQIEDKEIRAVTNKVIVKGNICVSVLYTGDGGTVEHTDARLPFTEVFELGESCEGDSVDVWCSVLEKNCNAEFDSDGDRRIISFEILVGVEMCARRERQISYLSDCYFFGAQTECEQEQITAERIITYPKTSKSLRESVACDRRMPKIASVYNVVAKPRIISTERSGDGVDISAKLDVSILYLSDSPENPVCCYKTDIPITHSIKATAGDKICISAECEHISYSLNSAGDVELRATISFNAEERETRTIDMMADIARGEETKGSEIIIFFAKGGEELWDIAKRFRVSCEEIAELNKLEPDCVIEENKRLIIPCM